MWDVFISHAREDKDAVALPLAEELQRRKIRVWFDRFALAVADPLSEKIEEGLKKSCCGVVVLSHAFFSKEWTRRELERLLSLEISHGKKIVPVWHGLTEGDVRKYSLVLANRVAVSTADGIEAVAAEIEKVARACRRLVWAKILAITLFVLLLVFLLLAFVVPLVQRLTPRTDRVAGASAFVIATPRESERVDSNVEVRGRTPFPALRHYLLVTPRVTGDRWVQTPAATVERSGATFAGPVQLGTSAGAGQRFTIQVLATRESISAGPLIHTPGDARFSPPVTVVRKP